MAMKKMLFTTHWTPSEVHNVLEFLSELIVIIQANYANELDEFYQEVATEERQEHFDFYDDTIPF